MDFYGTYQKTVYDFENIETASARYRAVSYTHLDVYKRQHLNCAYDLEQNRVSVNTYHGFPGRITPHPPIDYIFVSDEFVVRDTYLDTTHTGGLYPSDHFPLVAVLELKKQNAVLAG